VPPQKHIHGFQIAPDQTNFVGLTDNICFTESTEFWTSYMVMDF